MSAIKDSRSYFQGKIAGLREALVLLNSEDYGHRQLIQARIKEYEEVLSTLNTEYLRDL